jgi:hypothetical protein
MPSWLTNSGPQWPTRVEDSSRRRHPIRRSPYGSHCAGRLVRAADHGEVGVRQVGQFGVLFG